MMMTQYQGRLNDAVDDDDIPAAVRSFVAVGDDEVALGAKHAGSLAYNQCC